MFKSYLYDQNRVEGAILVSFRGLMRKGGEKSLETPEKQPVRTDLSDSVVRWGLVGWKDYLFFFRKEHVHL